MFSGASALMGCSMCYLKGCKIWNEASKSLKLVFLYSANPVAARTKAHTLECADMAKDQQRPILGVKGHSVLAQLKYFDYITDFVVDPMHAYFMHVVQLMLSFWFDSEYQVSLKLSG